MRRSNPAGKPSHWNLCPTKTASRRRFRRLSAWLCLQTRMRVTATRSRSWIESFGTRDSRKRPNTRYSKCRKRCLSRRNSVEEIEEDKEQEAHSPGENCQRQEERNAKTRCSATEGTRLFAEGRRRARALYGCDRRLSGGQARDLRARIATHRMATPGARAHRAVGHPGIQPQPQACLAGISRRLLAEDAGSASGRG